MCHSVRSMFRVLRMYNFGLKVKVTKIFLLFCRILHAAGEIAIHCGNARTIRGCGPGEGQRRGKGQPHKGHPPGGFRPILGRKYSVKGRVSYEINNTYRDRQTATTCSYYRVKAKILITFIFCYVLSIKNM